MIEEPPKTQLSTSFFSPSCDDGSRERGCQEYTVLALRAFNSRGALRWRDADHEALNRTPFENCDVWVRVWFDSLNRDLFFFLLLSHVLQFSCGKNTLDVCMNIRYMKQVDGLSGNAQCARS